MRRYRYRRWHNGLFLGSETVLVSSHPPNHFPTYPLPLALGYQRQERRGGSGPPVDQYNEEDQGDGSIHQTRKDYSQVTAISYMSTTRDLGCAMTCDFVEYYALALSHVTVTTWEAS